MVYYTLNLFVGEVIVMLDLIITTMELWLIGVGK